MEHNSTPGTTIIMKTWYDAAKDVLGVVDFGDLFKGIFEYAFYDNDQTANMSAMVRAMFALIKPAIDNDRVKYAERCERNRANAQRHTQSLPVAPSRSQSLPVAPSRSQSLPVGSDNNINNNNNNNNNNNVRSTHKEAMDLERKKDLFLCLGVMFSRGCRDIVGDFTRFWAYYESLGWKNSKGAAIISKKAAAAMWQTNTAVDTIAEERKAWYKVFATCDIVNHNLWLIYDHHEVSDNTCIVYVNGTADMVAKFDDTYVPQIKRLAKVLSVERVEYRLTNKQLQQLTI